jgi:sirohydrochlorin ferrochelatase
MQPKQEFDADEAAQDVVNACAMALQGGSLPADVNELFYKMQAYRNAKTIAASRREHDNLTEEEAERERTTKREFLDAYRAFYETRQ